MIVRSDDFYFFFVLRFIFKVAIRPENMTKNFQISCYTVCQSEQSARNLEFR